MIDQHLSNISKLAVDGRGLRENTIVKKAIDNDFFFNSAKIYCQNLAEAKGVKVHLQFKEKGRNSFDISISNEYKIKNGERKQDEFSVQFRNKTRREFRDVVIDLFGEYRDMPDLVSERGESYSLTDLPDVGPKLADRMEKMGYNSVSEVLNSEVEDLTEVEGIGNSIAKKILSTEV